MRHIIIVLIAISLISCSNNDEVTKKQNENISYINEEIKMQNDTLQYLVNINYPQLTGIENPKIEFEINSFISKSVKSYLDVFKTGFMSPDEYEQFDLTADNELYINDSILSLTDTRFTFYLEQYFYYVGAAHGNTEFITYNFNISDSHLLILDELFRENSDYIQKISELCINKLMDNTEYSDINWISEGASPNIENFENFLLLDEGIMFIFEPYAVAAYAAGPQFVTIPYEEMADILNRKLLKEMGIVINEVS